MDNKKDFAQSIDCFLLNMLTQFEQKQALEIANTKLKEAGFEGGVGDLVRFAVPYIQAGGDFVVEHDKGRVSMAQIEKATTLDNLARKVDTTETFAGNLEDLVDEALELTRTPAYERYDTLADQFVSNCVVEQTMKTEIGNHVANILQLTADAAKEKLVEGK